MKLWVELDIPDDLVEATDDPSVVLLSVPAAIAAGVDFYDYDLDKLRFYVLRYVEPDENEGEG